MIRLGGRSHRELAMVGASVFAVAAGWGFGASAQTALSDQGAGNGASTVKEIVVTGQRASLQSAQQIKKSSEQIVDSITATDIGALPDRSVTESLQRVAGVTITRMEDPRDTQRVSVEGAGVQIRGLSWVASELDGRDSFSATNGRALSFDDVPAELMSAINVYKNPSAELIEGGVGGTIDLRTRLPFDQPGHLVAFSADANYGDMIHTWKPSGSILLSDRWHTGIGEIGVLLDVSDSKLEDRTDTESVDPYWARTDLQPGKTVYVPGGFGYRSLIFNRERQGFDFATQWRPNDKLLATFQVFRSTAASTENEHAVGYDPDSATTFFPAATPGAVPFSYNSAGYFTNGTWADNAGGTTDSVSVLDERWNTSYDATTDYSLNLKWKPMDRLSVEADIQYIDSSRKAVDFTVFDEPTGNNLPAATINLNGNIPRFTIPVPAANVNNLADYYWDAAMDYHERNNANEWAQKVEAEYTFDSDWLKTFRFGVRHADQNVTTRETNYNWGAITQTWTGNGQIFLNGTLLNNGTSTQGVNAIPIERMSFGNFFGGAVPMPVAFPAAKASFMSNFGAAAKAIVATENCPGGVACGWTPFSGNYNSVIPSTSGVDGVNNQVQNTWAEYGLLRFGHDLSIMGRDVPMDGNFGLRVLETQASGWGPALYAPLTDGVYPASVYQFLNGVQTSVSGGRDYTNVLPSLNLRFKVTPEFFIRVGASKSIVRPTFQQMEASTTVTGTGGYLTGGTCGPNTTSPQLANNCVQRYSADAGSVGLKPMRANSYDIAFEYYFAKVGSLTADLFYKDVYDFITETTQAVNYTNNGVTESVNVTRPFNAGHGEIRGFEVAYQQYFTFLPGVLKGIGVQANYTNVESEGTKNASEDPFDPNQVTNSYLKLPLEGMSRQSYNTALLYDYGPWSARLSYNYRDKYLLTSSAANLNIPAWAGDYGQLDGSIFYTISKNLKVGVQAANLTNAITRTYVSYPQGNPDLPPGQTGNSWVMADRRVSLVLRGTF